MSYPKFLNRLDGCGSLYMIASTAPREDEYADIARVLEVFSKEYPTPGASKLIRSIKLKKLSPSEVVDQVRAFARDAAKVQD